MKETIINHEGARRKIFRHVVCSVQRRRLIGRAINHEGAQRHTKEKLETCVSKGVERLPVVGLSRGDGSGELTVSAV